jgi:prephenate dehydrogenase
MEIEGFPEIRTAAVLGLGLIGGSIARDLAERGVRVFSWDHDSAAVDSAMRQRIAEPVLWSEPIDVVVIAVPVLAAHDLLRKLVPRLDGVRLVTDVGSTKTSIVRRAHALGIGGRFVGSHPLAGDHRSGWDASRAGLFAGARVFLSPTPSTEPDALRLASALWTALGAKPEVMGADLHDVRLAWTSHLPQALSTALGLTIAQTGMGREELGPGGQDVARLAGSSPEMWADILIDNAAALDSAFAMFSVQLDAMHRAVARGDREALLRLFAQARDWHQTGS